MATGVCVRVLPTNTRLVASLWGGIEWKEEREACRNRERCRSLFRFNQQQPQTRHRSHNPWQPHCCRRKLPLLVINPQRYWWLIEEIFAARLQQSRVACDASGRSVPTNRTHQSLRTRSEQVQQIATNLIRNMCSCTCSRILRLSFIFKSYILQKHKY